MANEFIARKGLIVSGGVSVLNGSVTATFFAGDGSKLTNLPSANATSSVAIEQYYFVSDGATTNYVLSSSYNSQSLFVSVDGLSFNIPQDYSFNTGTKTITFVSAPPSASSILVRAFVNVFNSATGTFTGSFTGVFNGSITSASYALTASYAANAGNAVNFSTGSYTGSLTGSVLGSSSFATTASAATSITFIPATSSFAQNALTANSATSATSASFATTSSAATSITFVPSSASYATTASYASVAQNVLGSITSASYATTASYATVAQNVLGSITSASYATTSSFAQNALAVNGTVTASSQFAILANTTSSLIGPLWITSGTAYTSTGSYPFIGGGGGTDCIVNAVGGRAFQTYVQMGDTPFLAPHEIYVRSRGTTYGTLTPVNASDIIFQKSWRAAFATTSIREVFYQQVAVEEVGNTAHGGRWELGGSDPNTAQTSRKLALTFKGHMLFTASEAGDLGSASLQYRPRSIYLASGAFIGDNIPVNNQLVVSGTVWATSYTGSLSGSVVGSASYAPTSWVDIFNIPSGLVSSSLQFGTGSYTGSVTGNLLGSASYAISRTRNNITVTTVSLGVNVTETGSFTFAKSWYLLQIQSDRASRVRLYSTTGSRYSDGLRPIGIDPSSSVGVLSDFVFTGAQTLPVTPVIIGSNLEGTPVSSIPYLIENRSGGASTVAVTFTLLPLED